MPSGDIGGIGVSNHYNCFLIRKKATSRLAAKRHGSGVVCCISLLIHSVLALIVDWDSFGTMCV